MEMNQEFHVTYFEADCGRVRTEVFDTAADAERFASRCLSGEHDWATVDAVAVQQAQAAA
jgi:hypothetical protein